MQIGAARAEKDTGSQRHFGSEIRRVVEAHRKGRRVNWALSVATDADG